MTELVKQVELALKSDEGFDLALRIALLPANFGSSALVIDDSDESVPSIQLLEGAEYLYEVLRLPPGTTAVVEPREIFQSDSETGIRGRLRPGLFVGTLPITLTGSGRILGRSAVEVRSRKLNYRSEFRWMLHDIAEQVTELVMDRFSPSVRNFELDSTRDAVTQYQRFAFLQSLLTSDSFNAALAEIVRRPFVSWEETPHQLRPGQPFRADSRFARQLMKPGMRRESQLLHGIPIPDRLERYQREATYDNAPNRFVLHALEQWLQIMAEIDGILEGLPPSPTLERGRKEIAAATAQLQEIAGMDLFKDVSPMERFPADDQVLQRREGYREIFRAYQQFELAARLSWVPGEDVYSAGQRNIAKLYENWAFLQLAKVVSGLVGESFDLRPLVSAGAGRLNLNLRSGIETAVSGFLTRHGRRLSIELCFNRTFSKGSGSYASWTRPMRPDYSIVISPASDETAGFDPVVVHFDAKYRVNFQELFGAEDELANIETASNSEERKVLRADLLKMHSYRDAIRRSAGAYVLYPGTGDTRFSEYHEVLPGLGAFPLRPTENGESTGVGTIRQFLWDVVEHVAKRMTRHERARYWTEESYGQYHVPSSVHAPITGTPNSDTMVLLGYVKSQEHWQWIHAHKSYNVRSEGRVGGVALTSQVFSSQLILLYCPAIDAIKLGRIVSEPERVSQESMAATGYPVPNGDYICFQLVWLSSQSAASRLSVGAIQRAVQIAGRLPGEPATVPWGELVLP